MAKEQVKMISANEIRQMNEAQWNEYREKSWLKKRAYYNAEMPEYYLNNKERFASYIEKLASKKWGK